MRSVIVSASFGGVVLAGLLGACGSSGGSGSSTSAGSAGTQTGSAGVGGAGTATSGANNAGCEPGGASGADAGMSAGSSGGANVAGTAGSAGASAGVTPSVSSWLGTNVSADMPRVDVTYQLSPFDTPAANLDANGYPMPGFSGASNTDIGFTLPSGTYKLSYKGSGALTVSGIGALVGAFQSANGEQRAELEISDTPGDFGQFLTLKIANAAGQSVTDVHLLYPGFDYDSPIVFLPGFLNVLTPFRALRFMDWLATNNSALANWADRPAAAHFGQSTFGQPYEHIVALVNQTGKDAWINIPEHATDDFVTQLAQFLAKNLDLVKIQAARGSAGFSTPFQVLLENSNETWNGSFSAKATFLAAAKANPTRYSGTYTGTYGPSWMTSDPDLMRVAQYEADRLAKCAAIFRTAFGAHSGAIAPVLSGWALGTGYTDEGVRFIKDNYGDPKTIIKYVASAPYFNADDKQSGSLSALFTDINTNIASMDATYADFEKLVAEWGLSMAAYEGGQGLGGAVNQPIKHLAQHDQRMYEAYLAYFALWKKHFGNALFMHFSLSGVPGLPEMTYQYGYWGSIIGVLEDPAQCEPNLPTLLGSESIASVVHHCPKYRALSEQVP